MLDNMKKGVWYVMCKVAIRNMKGYWIHADDKGKINLLTWWPNSPSQVKKIHHLKKKKKNFKKVIKKLQTYKPQIKIKMKGTPKHG